MGARLRAAAGTVGRGPRAAGSICCGCLNAALMTPGNSTRARRGCKKNATTKVISSLAIFGGEPTFRAPLFVGRPNMGNRDRFLQRINDMLDRRWLTNGGVYVQEFEQAIAARLGVKHCIAMCNGTVALEIAIRAAELSGEVILPSLTFIATAHALQWQEITPVFCDIDPSTHNLDPNQVEALITPRTTGIIGVHLWGRPCPVDALADIAQRHGLSLLFDAAHAFGCTYRGRRVGGFGLAEVFSFHATKFLNTFEGGAVTTNDDELATKMRLMKNFGFAGYDKVIYIGTNGKMNEASAAMGITSLESAEAIIDINQRNYHAYLRALAEIPGLRVMQYDDSQANNYQDIVAEVDAAATGIPRDDVVAALHAENILARRYFFPGCHRMEPYRSYQPHAHLLLPETEAVADRLLVLPTGTAVTEDDIAVIGSLVRLILDQGPRISARLRESG
jgi:dTDP-4-amino-4,6-dideoxygalactose transaminase